MALKGHIFSIDHGKNQGENVPKKKLKNPESDEAKTLLRSKLMVQAPGSNTTESFDIEKVETWDGCDGKWEKAFDKIDREADSLFLYNMMGNVLVFVVVDPEKKSIVGIKEVKAEGKKSGSISTHLKRILGKDVWDLDGMSLNDPDCPIQVEVRNMDQLILDIAINTRKEAQTSGSRSKVRKALKK